jgi:diaminohydroxyphosphoribosylaminopyrimidine deaminase/5-amino-6-(5-phosphoribosylamino)uracil reductase
MGCLKNMSQVDDTYYMKEALRLAEKGRYSASPNPAVGCLIVKDRKVIGSGFHRRAGGPHAEIEAINSATESCEHATAYITLEPCSHLGKTGPCCEELIAERFSRVVYAVMDPNKNVAGKGHRMLRQAGIEVLSGVCDVAARELNKGFFKRMESNLPYITVKIAMSLDGATALKNGESKWITCLESRDDVQRLRAESCAILTGIGTVLDDDPYLNVRSPNFDTLGRQPMRVVLDSKLRMPRGSRLLAGPGVKRIYTANDDPSLVEVLSDAGAIVCLAPKCDKGVDVLAVLQELSKLEINKVLVEAGATLVGELIDKNIFDEIIVYMAPKILGKEGRRGFNMVSPDKLSEAFSLNLVESYNVGTDIAMKFLR